MHLAAVLADVILANLRRSRVELSLGAKVSGASHLCKAVQTLGVGAEPLVFFSSAAACFGNPGQANYAAANMCLDSMAQRSLPL